VRIPVWLLYGVAALVIIFGVHRIRIGFRSDAEDKRARSRKGLYAMARRTHILIGVVYVLLGSALLATALGWNPMGDVFGPQIDAPAKDATPTHAGIPADQLPAPATPKK
jgi:hypothetical protein